MTGPDAPRGARHGGRLDVELHDDGDDRPDGDVAPPAPAPRAARHRRWWAVGVVGVVVLALTAAQVVVDLRERSALADLRGVEGLLDPLDPGVGVRWERADPGSSVDVMTPEGRVLVSEREAPGGVALEGMDSATGDTLWRRVLAGGTGGSPPGARPEPVTCQAAPDGSGRLSCLRTGRWRQPGPPTTGTDGAAHLWTVDVRSGEVVGDVALEEAPTAFAMVAGTAVVVTPLESAVRVTGLDPLTGAARWRLDLPGPADDGEISSLVGRADAQALDASTAAVHDGQVITLVSSDGVELRRYRPSVEPDASGAFHVSWWTDRANRAAVSVVNGVTTLVTAERELTVQGGGVPRWADDGSAPGLVLTSGDTVRAWDVRSGEERWTADLDRDVHAAIVLRGRVHLFASDRVVTVDAATGRTLWRSPPDLVPTSPLSDGRVVLLVRLDDRGDGGELVALDVADGDERWRSPLPEHGWVTTTGGLLVVVVDDQQGETSGSLRVLG
ncbi:PQQ-binding-like beta-propeller repeat protein [Cellulomonas iranensis]|uniref:outer membrane protein assembly factor BamB family protein n=1 Tax=Cellulomonas iranensis TaxID=76862 RepID=UPI0006253F04|nr:PQQ-binding-like beta-propeller repeat protein [Cellulomonas iranensis]